MKRPVRPWICGALVLASCLALSARGQCQYEITQIYQGPVECTFDASITFANDLNDHGQACGAYYPCSLAIESRAWVSYGEGHFQVLNPPGAIESSAEVILNDGRVAGWY